VLETIERWESDPQIEVSLISDSSSTEAWVNSSLLKDRPWAQVADVLRMAPFDKNSGWYMDVDCEPGKTPLTNLDKTTLFRTEPNSLANGIFYYRDNPDFLKCWKLQIELGLGMQGLSVAECTGPGALTRSVYLYALENGVLRSRKELTLGEFQFFLHWPSQFIKVISSLPRFMREGKYATHFALASWDEPAESTQLGSLVVLKALLWRLRNSKLGPFFNYTRFLFASELKYKDKMGLAGIYAATRGSSDALAEVKTISELLEDVTTQSGLTQAVSNLKVVFIRCEDVQSALRLKGGGWEMKRIRSLGRVWVRPSLSSIMGKSLS
jgi:hypothetical protein